MYSVPLINLSFLSSENKLEPYDPLLLVVSEAHLKRTVFQSLLQESLYLQKD